MNLEDFLAMPMTPCIRLRIGPEVTDVVEIDQITYDARKDELLLFLESIPLVDGASWRTLKPYTNNNGLMAKILIALGELAGVWKMYPSPDIAILWEGHSTYPCVLAGSVQFPSKQLPASSVPKPSRGDLEEGPTCVCCDRTMGDERYFYVLQSQVDGWCTECEEGCPPEGPCEVNGKRPAIEKKANAEEREAFNIEGLEEYIKNINGGE